jgi:hypothetical protein
MNKCIFSFKIIRKSFCENFKFPKIKKDLSSLQRLDKISIFEYLKILDERLVATHCEVLAKELVDFIYSKEFTREFKFTFLNEEKKFKFFLMNLALISNRIQSTIKEDNLSFIRPKEFFIRKKIILFFKYLPIKFSILEVLKYYINQYQINSKYENNYIIQDEFLNKYNKLDFSCLRIRKDLVEKFDKIEEDEVAFEEKYISKFLLDSSERSIDSEKILLYFIAHVRILINLEKLFIIYLF